MGVIAIKRKVNVELLLRKLRGTLSHPACRQEEERSESPAQRIHREMDELGARHVQKTGVTLVVRASKRRSS